MRFRRKHQEIEAEQYIPHSVPPQIPNGVTCYEMPPGGLYIAFIDQIRVFPGDWIVMEDGRATGRMTAEHFEETYEPVPMLQWTHHQEALTRAYIQKDDVAFDRAVDTLMLSRERLWELLDDIERKCTESEDAEATLNAIVGRIEGQRSQENRR